MRVPVCVLLVLSPAQNLNLLPVSIPEPPRVAFLQFILSQRKRKVAPRILCAILRSLFLIFIQFSFALSAPGQLKLPQLVQHHFLLSLSSFLNPAYSFETCWSPHRNETALSPLSAPPRLANRPHLRRYPVLSSATTLQDLPSCDRVLHFFAVASLFLSVSSPCKRSHFGFGGGSIDEPSFSQ